MKPKTNPPTDQELVTLHIKKLDKSIASVIEYLRQYILASHPEVGERIKWNNPSFYYTGMMKAFDPKEYKRDIIVMNLLKNRIMLVFPSGAKLDDPAALLEGDYKDGRRLVVFKDIQDVKAKEKALKKLVNLWIALVDKD